MTDGDATRQGPPSTSKVVRVPNERPREVGRALFLGTLGMIPVVGSVLSELATTFYPDVKFQRFERATDELREAISGIEDRLDEEFVHQPEFAALFEEYLDRVTQARSDAKLAYFANALAHSMVPGRPEARDRERFMDMLDQLRPAHLRLLAALYRGAPSPPAEWPFTPGAAAWAAVGAATGELGSDALRDLGDLERLGLIHALEDGSTLLHVATDVQRIVTPFGREFVRFVSATAEREAMG